MGAQGARRDGTAWRLMKLSWVTTLLVALLIAGVPSSAIAVESDGDVGTEAWYGGACNTFSKNINTINYTAQLCRYVNVHDWLGYKQGLARVSRNYSGPEMQLRVRLYRNGALVRASGWKQAFGSSMDHWTDWWTGTGGCYYAQADFLNTWPDGSSTLYTNWNSGTVCF